MNPREHVLTADVANVQVVSSCKLAIPYVNRRPTFQQCLHMPPLIVVLAAAPTLAAAAAA